MSLYNGYFAERFALDPSGKRFYGCLKCSSEDDIEYHSKAVTRVLCQDFTVQDQLCFIQVECGANAHGSNGVSWQELQVHQNNNENVIIPNFPFN